MGLNDRIRRLERSLEDRRPTADVLFADEDGALFEVLYPSGEKIMRSEEYVRRCRVAPLIVGGSSMADIRMALGIVKEPVEPAEIQEPDLNQPPGPDVHPETDQDFIDMNEEE